MSLDIFVFLFSYFNSDLFFLIQKGNFYIIGRGDTWKEQPENKSIFPIFHYGS